MGKRLNPSFDVTLFNPDGDNIEEYSHVSIDYVLKRAEELLALAGPADSVSIMANIDKDAYDRGEYHSEFWASAYLVFKNYGGPEEGGWWYEAGELLETVECKDEADAENVKAELLERYKDQDSPYPLESVLNTGTLRVIIEDEKGKDFPEVKPHYE
jgi:hypothetical protein